MEAKKISPWLLLTTVLYGTLLAGIDRTVTNLALPHIITEFGITASIAGWVSTAYIITSAVFIPIFGKLGDVIGDRKVFVGGMLGFMATSLLTALSHGIGWLIVFRALQGITAAAILPTAMAAITKNFTEHQSRAQALGIWTSTNAAGGIIAPLMGGPLIDYFGWRSAFFINLPLGVIAVVLGMIYLTDDQAIGKKAFDVLGSVYLGLALSSFLLIIDRGQVWGWLSLTAFLCYFVAAISTVLFLLREKVVTEPLIDLKLFQRRTFSSTLATILISFTSLYSLTILLSLFAQQNLHYSALKTGLFYLPMAIPLLFLSPVGAKISRRLPPRFAIAIGLVGAAFAIFLFSLTDISNGLKSVILPLALFGAFWSITSSPLSTAIVSGIPKEQVGSVSGFRNLTSSIGGAVGITLFTTLYAHDQAVHMSTVSIFHSLYGLSAGLLIVAAIISLGITESSKDYISTDSATLRKG